MRRPYWRLPLKSGIVVPILVLLPNLIFIFLPPLSPANKASVPVALGIAENLSRAAVLIIPVFSSLTFSRRYAKPVLLLALLALALYYAAWTRYFTGGRSYELLGAPLSGVPLPLAVFPVIFLLASSYLLSSLPMMVAAALFGIFHIWVSAITL